MSQVVCPPCTPSMWCYGVQVDKTSCKLEAGICDGPTRVVIGNEAVCDKLRPFKAPEQGHVHLVAGTRLEFVSRKPNSNGSFPRRVVVVLCDLPEFIECLVNSFVRVDPSLVTLYYGVLEVSEHATRPRQSDWHHA